MPVSNHRGHSSAALAAAIALAAGLGAAVPATAEGAPERPRLQFSGTFYLWAAGLEGSQSIFGLPETDVDLKFRDILGNLDMAAAGIFEARGDRFGFLGEINYVKLSAEAKSRVGGLEGQLESKAFFALAALTSRAAETDTASVDLIGGLKYFRFDNGLGLDPGNVSASDTQDWVDATVGVKASFDLAPKWSLKTWAMVGAGGSDLSWDALVALDYRINDSWSASVGYRAMEVDYSSSDFSYDMRQYGPILGLTRRF